LWNSRRKKSREKGREVKKGMPNLEEEGERNGRSRRVEESR
jgi:hypothetical protein